MKELLKKFFEELGLFVNFENPIEPDVEVKEGEKVIGEMNDMEKGLYTFIQVQCKKHDGLVDSFQRAHELINKEEIEKVLLKHEKIHCIISLANEIMWTSISSRLEIFEKVSIRKGFKVVETCEEDGSSGYGMTLYIIG